MESILRYKDYRKYIRDYYTREKKASALSWRKFSKRAKFSSPNFLRQVCEGCSNLSMPSAERVAEAMGLTGYEKDFFQNLVSYNQNSDTPKGNLALEKLRTIAKENGVRKIGKEEQTFYDTWLHSVMRELAPAMGRATTTAMAKRCRFGASTQDVERSIGFLLQTGLLIRTAKGTYRQTEKIVEGDTEKIPPAIRSMNRKMAGLAIQALDRVPVAQREFTGITMGLSQQSYTKILGVLASCRKKILDIVAKEENVDRVYRLNLQLFPMTVIEEESEDEDF